MLSVSLQSCLLALAIQQNIFEGSPQPYGREKGRTYGLCLLGRGFTLR